MLVMVSIDSYHFTLYICFFWKLFHVSELAEHVHIFHSLNLLLYSLLLLLECCNARISIAFNLLSCSFLQSQQLLYEGESLHIVALYKAQSVINVNLAATFIRLYSYFTRIIRELAIFHLDCELFDNILLEYKFSLKLSPKKFCFFLESYICCRCIINKLFFRHWYFLTICISSTFHTCSRRPMSCSEYSRCSRPRIHCGWLHVQYSNTLLSFTLRRYRFYLMRYRVQHDECIGGRVANYLYCNDRKRRMKVSWICYRVSKVRKNHFTKSIFVKIIASSYGNIKSFDLFIFLDRNRLLILSCILSLR